MRMKIISAAQASVLLFLTVCVIVPVSADDLDSYWTSARIKWNAVGDKTAAGDQAAMDQLLAAIKACTADERCRQGPKPLTPPTQKQIDAAGAALNLGWLYKNGKLGDPDDARAMDYYIFAKDMGHPIGAYNVGAMLETGKFTVQQPNEIVTLYMSAALSGSVAAAMALARLNEKAGYKSDAAKYYLLALEKKPTQKERELAEKKLAALGVTPEQIAAALAEKSPRSGGAPKPLPEPTPVPTPQPTQTKPQIRQMVVNTARDCIASVHEMDEGSSPRAMWIERCVGKELTQAEYAMVCTNNPSNLFCRNARSPGAPAPKPAAAPAKPQLNQAHLSTARDCIARANETSRMKSDLRRERRKLEERKKELQLSKRKLDNTYNYIPPGPEGDIIQNAANNNYARFNDKIDDYNAMLNDYEQDRHKLNRKADEWNDRCGGAPLTKPEYDVVCTNNRSNLFCKGFPNYRQ